jgi:hypothetical protein
MTISVTHRRQSGVVHPVPATAVATARPQWRLLSEGKTQATPGSDPDRRPLSSPLGVPAPALHPRVVPLIRAPWSPLTTAVQWPRELTARALSERTTGKL